ncbi:MAG TPA: hypothetical protein V6C90_06265 [Coleofasciculaceae cyanobacterium]
MRDIIQKVSNTDKQTTSALRRSVWLSYLLSIGAISAGGLSIFSVGAILGTKPAQANMANMEEQPVSLPAQTVEEEPASQTQVTELNFAPPVLAQPQPRKVVAVNAAVPANRLSLLPARTTTDNGNLLGQFPAGDKPTTVQPDNVQNAIAQAPALNSVEPNQTEQLIVGDKPTTVQLDKAHNAIAQAPALNSVEPNQTGQLAVEDKPTTVQPDEVQNAIAQAPALNSVEPNQTEQLIVGDKPTTVQLDKAHNAIAQAPTLNSVEPNQTGQLAVEDKPTTVLPAKVLSPTQEAPTLYKGSGAASLLGGNIQAQSSVEGTQESPSQAQNSPEINPLAPTLTLQGVVLNQGDTSARARLSGIYPISPNALFGGSVDLTTGKGFSDSPGGGLQLNELYFTGSLPSLPSLRLTAGLVDLTSYFDRNSFAKDSTTHFFNPVFQTNPALSAAGIGSRPAVLLNWDVTDNLQARAAAFSSYRNLGDLGINAFAGEVAFRAGNAIIRGTYASDRDAERNNGFKEIYGIPRDNGETGVLSSDRENSYGINAEYFIPEIKMGLFGRYGRYENTGVDQGGDTYSLGLNFLDLFMQDDRLGFGYGRDLSNNEMRRKDGNKVPDVWELFYDFRVSPYLRAGVTLQARDEFSDVTAGFRVKTEFDLTSLGRLIR